MIDVLSRTTVMHPSDEVLVQLAVRNEQRAAEKRAAFSDLYHRHADRIYRYALARLGNAPDAQDVTAQTFLAAYEKLRQFQGRGTFAAWITGIARHKVQDHLRHRKSTLSLDDDTAELAGDGSPEDWIDDQLWLDKAQQAIQRLPAARAEALTLRIFAGLSAAEVGEVMGKSEDAVRMLVRRAINDLQAAMEDGQ